MADAGKAALLHLKWIQQQLEELKLLPPTQSTPILIADNHGAVLVKMTNTHQPARRTRHVLLEMKHFVILQWNYDEHIHFCIKTNSDEHYSD